METQTVAQKLEALVKLQSIDSKLDELIKLRGDLPDEVQDLEDEMEGYKPACNDTRMSSKTLRKTLRRARKESRKLKS